MIAIPSLSRESKEVGKTNYCYKDGIDKWL